MAYGFKAGKNKETAVTPAELETALEPATQHIADSTIHVTSTDKSNWNAKVGLTGGYIDRSVIDAGDVTTETIAQNDINNGETVSKTISYSRAYVVINSGNLKLAGVYIKSAGVIYGMQALATLIGQYSATADLVSAGAITSGSYYKEATANDHSMSFTVDGTGISFTNTSTGNGCAVNMYAVELA